MKLLKFNTTNVRQVQKGTSTLRIVRTGQNSISAFAANKIGFMPGDRIAMVQDEEEPADWYLMRDPEGFELRQPNGAKSLHFSNAAMSNSFLDALRIDGESVSFKLVTEKQVKGKEKYELYPIITASAEISK